MLPVLICEADPAVRAMISAALEALDTRVQLRIAAVSGTAAGIWRSFEQEKGVSLTLIGLRLHPDNRDECLDLGRRIMQQNRDNFTVYLIHDQEGLQDILLRCGRAAGMLLAPFAPQSLTACLQRVVDEYASMEGAEDDDGALTITCASTTYRIPYGQIAYIEALDKKLVVYTARQAITLRCALGVVADDLPDIFVRCHRSYIVNLNYVRRLDAAESLLVLSGGENVPIARSAKATLKQRLSGAGGNP